MFMVLNNAQVFLNLAFFEEITLILACRGTGIGCPIRTRRTTLYLNYGAPIN